MELARLMLHVNENLVLKKGAMVMLTCNLSIEDGLCNGSQGIVVDFKNNEPMVRFRNGMTRHISPHFWQSEEWPTLAIGQYPLILAWALTIHKIQGATLDCAEMDLGSSVFAYGQTYVALSRVKSIEGVYIKQYSAHKIRANPIVQAFYANLAKTKVMYDDAPIQTQTQTQKETVPETQEICETVPEIQEPQQKIEMPASSECVVCLDRKANSILHHQTTGHLCCCHTCAGSLTLCPICREPITSITRVFTM
jgi:hypothetical protein